MYRFMVGKLLWAVCFWIAATGMAHAQEAAQSAEGGAHLKVQLRGIRDRVEIRRTDSGELVFVLTTDEGEIEVLTPAEFTARVFDEQTQQRWWNRLFNITSPLGFAWVTLGLLGQILFTGRMLVQWLVSERQKRSVVPAAFWWMSLVGASMLLVYFIWRRDIVGVLGQTTGWMIYSRNLWLIYRLDAARALVAERSS